MRFNNDNSFDITIVRGGLNPIVFKSVLGSWNEAEQQIIAEIENHRVKSHVILEKNSKVVIFDNVSNTHHLNQLILDICSLI